MAKLIRQFQDEIDKQQDYIWSPFMKMEQAGSHELLNQDYKQWSRTIQWQWCVHFTPTPSSDSFLPVHQPPTPYPQSIPSSSPSPHLTILQYSLTVSHYSPTTSQYKTPPKSPVFILEVLFLNPDSLPTFDGWDLLEQVQEQTMEEHEWCQHIEWQIEIQVQSIERGQVNWADYQGGIGTRFNPIIVEDDWNQGFQI